LGERQIDGIEGVALAVVTPGDVADDASAASKAKQLVLHAVLAVRLRYPVPEVCEERARRRRELLTVGPTVLRQGLVESECALVSHHYFKACLDRGDR
jgi:hypothetical protein